MASDEFELFSREEVLSGLSGGHTKRAATLLTAIENRTAHLAIRSKQALELFLTEEAAEERELAFLEALAHGRELPLRPMIQDVERYAAQWTSLVPGNPRVQAAVAHLLGRKYEFTYQAVPGIRAALGLDEEAVRGAYQRLYHKPLETIFTPQVKLIDRLRWVWSRLAGRLESLPPFWTAFALTLTETVGAGILALPIALARVGPLAGVILLVVLGLANVLTIAATAEAVARNGKVRYGNAYFGRLVADYLGSTGSLIFTLALIILTVLPLMAYYIGFASTLANATSIPAEVWTALIFFIGLYSLSRKSLDLTVASALVIGAINIGLILLLSLIAFTHLQLVNLFYMEFPFLDGRHFDASILELIFGVILLAYFGHTSAGNCARVVLRRDPSARSLIWGSITALAAAMILYCIWVLAINGAIAPEVLAIQVGTSLAPLAARVGAGVHILGSIFVILSMGMVSIHLSLGLFYLIQERLPKCSRAIVVLPRRQGRLLFRQRGIVSDEDSASLFRFGLTYLGHETNTEPGQKDNLSRFRLDIQLGDKTRYQEITFDRYWEASMLHDQFSEFGERGIGLTLEVLEATEEHIRLQVTSPMRLTYEGAWDTVGLNIADVFTLPDSQRQLVNWLMREGITGKEAVSLAEVVAHTGQDEIIIRTTLETLVVQGFIRELNVNGETRYQPRLVSKQSRRLSADIRQVLDKKFGAPTTKQTFQPTGMLTIAKWIREAVLSEHGRFFLSVSPMIVIFLVTEWLFLTGTESFTKPLSFTGTITATLVGGIFPVLMLVSSRRKGEFVPDVVLRFLGHPFFITILYLLFLISLFLHGLIIWNNPVERAVAVLVGLTMVGATIIMKRQEVFAPRIVVELREDQSKGGQTSFAVVADGEPVPAEVWLGYTDGEQQLQVTTSEIPAFSSLRYVNFQLPATKVRELKVWTHRITPEGTSEGLFALLTVYCGHEKREFDMKISGGEVILPLNSEPCRLEISFTERESEH